MCEAGGGTVAGLLWTPSNVALSDVSMADSVSDAVAGVA